MRGGETKCKAAKVEGMEELDGRTSDKSQEGDGLMGVNTKMNSQEAAQKKG